jgi:peroxiredoxin
MANRYSLLVLAFLCLAVSSCNQGKTYSVWGKISGANQQMLYLKELTTVDEIPIDSMKISENGSFSFKAKSKRPAFYSLGLSANNYIILILHPGEKVFVRADASDLTHTYAVGGSKDSELARKLNNKINSSISEINKLHKIYMDSLGTKNILKTRQMLDTTSERIENDQRSFSINFINENVGSLASVMALYQELSPRKPVFSTGTDYFLFKKVDSVMMKKFPEADPVKSLHSLVQNLSSNEARKAEMNRKLAIGATAPDIDMQGPFGNNLKLSSLRGKYVLLEFWATWKEASVKSLPDLVRLYWRYKNSGFDIYQVSLDTNKELWLKTITNYGMPWPNVCNFKMYESPAVSIYNVTDVPTRFLIDPNGKIIAKNLDLNSLSAKLKEIFKY